MKIMLASFACAVLVSVSTANIGHCASGSSKPSQDGWVNMFDGQTLKGWKVSTDHPESFKVVDGAIVANGDVAHLYYETEKPFVNFEFEADVMTKPKSNSGIYFHTKYQDVGWPKYGYECQVNATHDDPKKTASLYGVENLAKAPHDDNEWFKYDIRVEGRHIVIKINDKLALDYTEPAGKKPGEDFTRVVDRGTIALQAHDPGSTVMYKNLRIRRLP
ncbi:MAG: DUF1080 domain-containing protein [Pirellulales bacterium]|nr:DUF1080 domain-containing protein [Pirellulales bacterium]